jgi:tRNA-dihydrouridine synthase 4
MSTDSFVERIFGLKDDTGKKRATKIVAPMVRYSKLPFRLLAYKYGTKTFKSCRHSALFLRFFIKSCFAGADLCFTPMIVAESFNQSQKARDSEFKTNECTKIMKIESNQMV